MKKPKIYIETTIPNFYFDFKNQSKNKKVETVYFWDNLADFTPVTSLATIRELEATPNQEWRKLLLEFIKGIDIIALNKEILTLAEQYVADGLIPQKYSADAVHLATTVVSNIDYLLTWNIQHLAHPIKRKQFRDYNSKKGLYVTEIVTPQDLNENFSTN